MVKMNLFAEQKQSHRCSKTNLPRGEGGGWDELGDWD